MYYLFRKNNILPSTYMDMGPHEKEMLRTFVMQSLIDDLEERPKLQL